MVTDSTVYKGMRVFPPKKHEQLSHVLAGWRRAAEAYGYQEYRTPLIDPADLYTEKTSDEIIREQTYAFADRGGRDVLLRPEITPGASAMVADLQRERKVHVPYKIFSIGSVFRYERAQRGRSREHLQFNADLFGEQESWADAEVINLACSALESTGLSLGDIEVRINDRASLESVLTGLGMNNDERIAVTRLLDRREKIEPELFQKELRQHTDISIDTIENALSQEPDSVTSVMQLLNPAVTASYDPLVIRGFDYYTGIVFEFYTTDRSIMSRSLVGGGRYDRLIESYGGSPLPAVGFGMGDTVLLDCLDAYNVSLKSRRPFILVYASSDDHLADAKKTADELRSVSAVTFFGTVPKNRQAAVNKRNIEDGASLIVRKDDSGYVVRSVKTKKETTYQSHHAIISFMKTDQSVPWHMRLLSLLK